MVLIQHATNCRVAQTECAESHGGFLASFDNDRYLAAIEDIAHSHVMPVGSAFQDCLVAW